MPSRGIRAIGQQVVSIKHNPVCVGILDPGYKAAARFHEDCLPLCLNHTSSRH